MNFVGVLQIAFDYSQRLFVVWLIYESVNILVTVLVQELNKRNEEGFVLSNDCDKFCKAQIINYQIH